MIQIRRVYNSGLPSDRDRIEQVKVIFRANFPYLTGQEDSLADILDNPFRYGYLALLLVSENASRRVTGFALILHFPEIHSSFLDFIGVDPKVHSGGLGSALYEAARDVARQLGVSGMYLEALSDNPAYVSDENELKQNCQRLRFYEQYAVYPIANNLYEEPTATLPAAHLLYDDLGNAKALTLDTVRTAVRLIISKKYKKDVGPGYISKVTQSFRDDPVQFRAPKYLKRKSSRDVRPSRLQTPFALVATKNHTAHLVHQRGYVERPARIGAVMEGLAPLNYFADVSPKRFGEGSIRAVHDNDFVNYLKAVCKKLEPNRPVYPYVFPIRRPDRPPKDLSVRSGYYCVDTFTPLDKNAYDAARSAVDVVLTAADELLAGRRVTYALCRPPGHHAGKRTFGGFCYFNNAAIAAHRLSKVGNIAVLDIDYHHGNGTQEIFYNRSDVLTLSIHGHPSIAYPHFSGFTDETGDGEGLGFNRNYPLPEGADGEMYLSAFEKAVERIRQFKPDILILSLGLDTIKGDPTGSFKVPVNAMNTIGARLGSLRLPLLVVQEGGYSLRNLRRGVPALFQGIAQHVSLKR